MRMFLVIVLALLPITGNGLASMEKNTQVVLVCNETTTISPLNARELRKLYLGIPIIRHGLTIKALVNRSNPKLFELFLQKVMHVSEHYYVRQLLSRVLRLGGEKPKSFVDENQLLNALHQGTNRVTYLPMDETHHPAGIKVIQRLW